MKRHGIDMFVAAVAATLSIAQAAAEPALLTRKQLVNRFAGGLTFSLEASKGSIAFHFSDDNVWTAETTRGTQASGEWYFEKRTVCRRQTAFSSNWKGLRRDFLCFGVKLDGEQLLLGGKNLPMALADSSALDRLAGRRAEQRTEESNTDASGQARLEREKLELERTRLELERQRIADEARMAQQAAREREEIEAEKREIERMRLALEKEKLRQEKSSLATRAIETPTGPPNTREKSDIDFGAYHAIVIGINDYKSLPDLNTALADARAVARTLEADYGYSVNLLENPTRSDILDKLDELRETLTENDNLLIYYAGHGWLDPQSGRGYWLPVDARSDRRSRWFSNGDLTDALQALFAKHVMVIADSCYSGTLTRSVKVTERNSDYIARMAKKRTRVVLSSGGLEPVSDAGGGRHSIFAAQFLDALRKNADVLDGTQLFEVVRRNVVLNAEQTPQYSDIRRAGHEGGDFLFVRKR